jgi:hypothetical protein
MMARNWLRGGLSASRLRGAMLRLSLTTWSIASQEGSPSADPRAVGSGHKAAATNTTLFWGEIVMAMQHIPSTFARAAFPLGGIGTGTVSLGARGELRDWENQPDD